MFTGIIETQLQIREKTAWLFRMACDFSDELTIGQSIAHNGACMTITTLGNDRYEFFIMEESLSKTSFAAVQPGEFCNIERCLRVGDRLDGHMVTGHIDTTARITHIEEAIDGSKQYTLSYGKERDTLVVAKGSIALDGVSITVVDMSPGSCSVRIIPHTQQITRFGRYNVEDVVNVEFDLFAKYVHKHASLHT